VSVGAIIVIAIAATGILLMRFRKRWLAKINIAFTNRITSLFAGWLPGFGILTHVGRKSGKEYRTPVNMWLANCYFAYNSLEFPVLLGFRDARSVRPFHPFHRYPGSHAP
jgi:hypothetical protein